MSTGTEQRELGALSREDVFEVFSNRRRRYAIHYLKRQDEEEVPLDELAEQVAAWENEKPMEKLSSDERKRVLTALRQFHLPKMDAAGFVEFDRVTGSVELSDPAADLDVYLDVVPGRAIPWGVYYLAVSGLSMAAVFAAWADVFPVPHLAVAAGIVVGFAVSALVHTVVSVRQQRFGATETPPTGGGQ